MSVWRNYVWPAVAILTFFVMAPIFVPLFLVIWLYHVWLINRLAERCRPGEVMKQTDAIWYYDTKENPAIINTIWWMKGKLDFEEWVRHVDAHLAGAKDASGRFMYPKLLATIRGVWRRFVWVPCDGVNVRNHVVWYDEKPAEDRLEVERIASQVASRELPKDLPQWQIVLIPLAFKCPNGEDQFVAVLRIHHAVGDGISLVRMMMHHFVDEPPTALQQETRRFGTQLKMLILAKACLSAPRVILDVFMRPFDHNPLHGPHLCGNKLVAWSEKIDLDRVKSIKNALGYTVNDVLLGCLASGVARYFRLTGEGVPQDIMVAIPVDVRSAKPGGHDLDNQFALVFLQLPLHEKDLQATIRATKQRMDVIKGSADALVYSLATQYLLACLPIWVTKWMMNLMSDTCSLPVSNVPGPQQLLTVSGHPVDQIAFWPPQKSKVGVSVSLMSYNGSITMGVSVDSNIMQRPRHLVELFEKSVDDLAKDLGIVEGTISTGVMTS